MIKGALLFESKPQEVLQDDDIGGQSEAERNC